MHHERRRRRRIARLRQLLRGAADTGTVRASVENDEQASRTYLAGAFDWLLGSRLRRRD